LVETILNNGGAISTTELRVIFNLPTGGGLGHLPQRLRALINKRTLAKSKGVRGGVIYFVIDAQVID